MAARVKEYLSVGTTLLLLASSTPAFAQRVTTVTKVENLTAEQALAQLANAMSSRPIGETIALTSAVEIATTPLFQSSGGFTFEPDPVTGLLRRTTTTFGPSVIDRAITAGEGKVAVGATFTSVTYSELSGFPLSKLPLSAVSAAAPVNSRTLTGNLALTAKTLTIAGNVGVTENLDVGVIVPLVSVKLAGNSSMIDGQGVVLRLAETDTVFGGIGDVAAIAKYRFVKFESPDVPDPGGMALVVNVRLPTGDRENLRGLGVTRTLVSGVVSAARGRLRPHASAGFEHWSKSVGVGTDLGQTVSIRHRFQYAAGLEVAAAPKVTLLLEFLGQEVLGGGQIEVSAENTAPNVPGINAAESMVAVRDGIRKAMIVPGLKVNLKGKMLLSLNAMFTLTNNGLRPKVTPVAGIFLTM